VFSPVDNSRKDFQIFVSFGSDTCFRKSYAPLISSLALRRSSASYSRNYSAATQLIASLSVVNPQSLCRGGFHVCSRIHRRVVFSSLNIERFCLALRSCLFVFPICMLLAKMDSFSTPTDRKMRDLKIRSAISRLTCLEKMLLNRTK
jgi:hypothetical protein